MLLKTGESSVLASLSEIDFHRIASEFSSSTIKDGMIPSFDSTTIEEE
ncbi:MAG: hypothetical protein ACXAEN_18770 [Candidatus Thorarchaeota archaeon]